MQSGCWLTDPLDGTLEFVHGNPNFSCVVSYVEGGEPQVGAVYFAVFDELFSAAIGQGATLNGAPIHVSGVTGWTGAVRDAVPQHRARAGQGLHGAHVQAPAPRRGVSYARRALRDGRLRRRRPLRHHILLESLPGAGAGRPFQGQPWETAAFVVLVQEAGGAVARLGGGPPDLLAYNAYAASPELLEQYFAVMAD